MITRFFDTGDRSVRSKEDLTREEFREHEAVVAFLSAPTPSYSNGLWGYTGANDSTYLAQGLVALDKSGLPCVSLLKVQLSLSGVPEPEWKGRFALEHDGLAPLWTSYSNLKHAAPPPPPPPSDHPVKLDPVWDATDALRRMDEDHINHLGVPVDDAEVAKNREAAARWDDRPAAWKEEGKEVDYALWRYLVLSGLKHPFVDPAVGRFNGDVPDWEPVDQTLQQWLDVQQQIFLSGKGPSGGA